MKSLATIVFVSASLLAARQSSAQTSSSSGSSSATSASSAAPYSCADDPERHRFDFWLGAWDVKTKEGAHVGDSIIETASNGCAVLENWTGAKGGTGKSLNSYNPQLKQWEQFWIGSDGMVHEYRESSVDGNSLVFIWRSDSPAHITRLSFTPLDKDTVRQFSEISTDGGKTWKTGYDFYYHRRLPTN